MLAVIRLYRHLKDFDRVAQLVDTGLVPILKEIPGFQGYYAIRCGETTGISLTLFENDKALQAGHEKGATWVRAHLDDLYDDHPPETMMGEVLIADAPPDGYSGVSIRHVHKDGLRPPNKTVSVVG